MTRVRDVCVSSDHRQDSSPETDGRRDAASKRPRASVCTCHGTSSFRALGTLSVHHLLALTVRPPARPPARPPVCGSFANDRLDAHGSTPPLWHVYDTSLWHIAAAAAGAAAALLLHARQPWYRDYDTNEAMRNGSLASASAGLAHSVRPASMASMADLLRRCPRARLLRAHAKTVSDAPPKPETSWVNQSAERSRFEATLKVRQAADFVSVLDHWDSHHSSSAARKAARQTLPRDLAARTAFVNDPPNSCTGNTAG